MNMNLMYEAIETIGQGAYGKVIKARNKQDGSLVAIKQLKTQSTEEGIPQTTLREITFLKDLDHPNIVKLLNVVITLRFFLIVSASFFLRFWEAFYYF